MSRSQHFPMAGPKKKVSDLIAKYKTKAKPENGAIWEGRLIAVDPGETTGITIVSCPAFEPLEILAQYQLDTWPLEGAVKEFTQVLDCYTPIDLAVYETYHVYKWRLAEHTFSEIPTIQIIGCFKTLCIQRGILFRAQTAQVGKSFWTDERLTKFDVYFSGLPHARDSLRHALQFLLFGHKNNN